MFFISSASIKNNKIGDSVRELALSGFKNIELSGGTKYYEGYIDELLELKIKFELNYQVHNYFPPQINDFVLNFVSDNLDNFNRSCSLMKEAIDKLDIFGASIYAFHPGYAVELKPEKKDIYFDYDDKNFNKEEKLQLFYDRFDLFITEVARNKRIAIENLFPFNREKDYSLFSRPEEVFGFLGKYKENNNIGILLDLGHLNVASYYLGFDKNKFIDQLFVEHKEKIFEIHLSENNGRGDQHKMHESDSWQLQVVKSNYEYLSTIPVTFEWHIKDLSKNTFNHYLKLCEMMGN